MDRHPIGWGRPTQYLFFFFFIFRQKCSEPSPAGPMPFFQARLPKLEGIWFPYFRPFSLIFFFFLSSARKTKKKKQNSFFQGEPASGGMSSCNFVTRRRRFQSGRRRVFVQEGGQRLWAYSTKPYSANRAFVVCQSREKRS